MQVRRTNEKCGGACDDSRGAITARVTGMVQDETQQRMRRWADGTPEVEVGTQADIEVRQQRTGARYCGHRIDDGRFDTMVHGNKCGLELCATMTLGARPSVTAL